MGPGKFSRLERNFLMVNEIFVPGVQLHFESAFVHCGESIQPVGTFDWLPAKTIYETPGSLDVRLLSGSNYSLQFSQPSAYSLADYSPNEMSQTSI